MQLLRLFPGAIVAVQRPDDRRELLLIRCADHGCEDHLPIGRIGAMLGDQAAVAQHDDAIRNRHQMIHVVAAEEDGGTLLPPFLDEGEQALLVGIAQEEARLVNDDQPGRVGHRPGDGDQLALFTREIGRPFAQRRVGHPQLRQDMSRLVVHAAPVRHLQPPAGQLRPTELVAQKDVAGDVQPLGHLRLLVDNLDPQGARAKRPGDAPAVEVQLAGGGCVEAGQQQRQRRLTGPTLPGEAHDLARVDLQAHLMDQRQGAQAV